VPSTQEHLNRAKNNLRLAQSFDLKTTPYIDWVVTFYFYAALHLIDALIHEKEGRVPEAHEIRKTFVKDRSYLRGIRDEYLELKDRSEDARYRLITVTSLKIENVVIPLYRTIEAHIMQQIPKETK
jgi:hypothetical protein